MESLRANYTDEEEDDDSNNHTQCNGSIRPPSRSQQNPPHSPNTPTTATNHDHNDANGEFEDAEDNNNINENNEDNDDCEDGDDAEQPTNLPIQPSSDETEEDEEDDPRAPKSQQPSNRPIQPSSDETDEEEEEDDDTTPARKKQKALSSITSPSASPATDAEALPSVDAAAENSTPAIARKPKKKKTKAVNVWTKSTSRKGKKKSKPGAANGQESAVLITPIPRFPDKSDDSPDMKICLSKVHKAEKVELSDDRLSAGSTKGYRMVRATRGVVEGAWFFEIKVVKLGETGHTRLGWSMEKGDLQAPVGYDGNSFGYRDVDGSKVHKALREKYGEDGYVEGDVVGCYINLPEGSLYAPKPPNLVWYKGQRYAYAADGKEDPPKVVPGSEITFFKNGVCQGVAFTDLHGGRYYPAASMYTLPNQPNCVVKFNFGPDFMFFPQDLGERPTPSPMIEVPYHGYDGRVVEGLAQNGTSGEKKH